MTRHPRSAALLSVTALAGVSLSLALAPSATAAIPTPPLGTLSADPSAPTEGDLVRISGTGCFTLAAPGTSAPAPAPGTDATAGDATDAGASVAAAPAPAVAPVAPQAGAISITVTGPGSFNSGDTATASDDGTWAADQGVTVGGAGTYTVDATCTLTDPVLGQSVTFDYDSLSLEVAAPEQTLDPALTCSGCDDVNPGGSVALAGTGFPQGTVATVALSGYTSQTSPVDAGGAFAPVSFTIRADQAATTLSGTVTAGAASLPFTVAVTVPESPGQPSVDGPVTGGGDTDSGDTDTAPVDVSGGYTSSRPTLPVTGTDSVWPGVVGGTLVLTGAGLLWLGRRREDSGVTAA